MAQNAEGDQAYQNLVPLAGDSHQHAATFYMIARAAKQPPVPGFPNGLHENSAPGDAFDVLRNGGYDWMSLSSHDTNHPGYLANICVDTMSEKYQWWSKNMVPSGFPDATRPGQAVNPPANEALALSRLATSKTVEGVGGFLAFTGREFTTMNFAPSGVGSRQSGHKVVVIPGETQGMCAPSGVLVGDEYCTDEAQMYLWALAQPDPRPVIIQAHPGPASLVDFRPFHPKNAPGGLTDQLVQGIEIGSEFQDPQWEGAYDLALSLGYKVFPAYGSDDHYATYPGVDRSPHVGATVCWATSRTKRALVEAMQARRCYFSTSWKPELRFSARARGTATWLPMGSDISASGGLVDLRIHVRNDPRNANANPRLGNRFDSLDLVNDQGAALATCGLGAKPPFGARACSCTRSADGQDVCVLDADAVPLRFGAFYARVRMDSPDPAGCRSRTTPDLLPLCGVEVVSAPIFVNWPQQVARSPYRQCLLDPSHLPCGTPGCLPAAVDHDQDGWPDDCDVCPAVPDPGQADSNLDGIGDACGRDALPPPQVLGAG
ncbi:MAG TPA: hypothetical protein VMR50_14630 [Myxococcota bacterium]|nr:hypothetical protein [Myxococcota bacterium]